MSDIEFDYKETAEPTINSAELIAELDKYRPKAVELTEEQYQLIRAAREHERQVTWLTLMELFKDKGWGRIPATTLREKYTRAKRSREE
jgi:hypothetical protein